MINLALSNPSTLQISAKKFVLIPEEGANFDYPLLIQQRNNRVKIAIVDNNNALLDQYFFDIADLNNLLVYYSENILFEIVEFLYEHSFISEKKFMEKILLLRQKYTSEFIIRALNSMDTQQLKIIFTNDNAFKYFESFI